MREPPPLPAASNQPAPGDFRLRSLFIPAFLPSLLFGIGQGAVVLAMPLYAKGLGAAVPTIALIVALRGIGTMVADIPAGVIVSRFGERWAMVGASLVLIATAVVTSLSDSTLVFAAVSFVMGGAWAVFQLARMSYVAERTPMEWRGRALSTIGGLGRVGNLIGPLLAGYLAIWFGLGAAFYLQAVLGGAAALVLFFVIDDVGMQQAHGSNVYQRFFGILRDHREAFATGGLAAVMLQVLRNGRQIILPLWGDALGFDLTTISWVYSASNLVDSLMFYPAGYAMDRWGRKFVVLSSMGLLSLGMVLVPVSYNPVTLALVGLIAGVGNGLGAGIVQTLGADFSPTVGRGEFLGVWRLLSDIGGSAGPAILGAIAGAATLGTASVATGGIGVAGMIVIYLAMPEPLQRDRRQRGRPPVP